MPDGRVEGLGEGGLLPAFLLKGGKSERSVTLFIEALLCHKATMLIPTDTSL
jgi:hypothetical protein